MLTAPGTLHKHVQRGNLQSYPYEHGVQPDCIHMLTYIQWTVTEISQPWSAIVHIQPAYAFMYTACAPLT